MNVINLNNIPGFIAVLIIGNEGKVDKQKDRQINIVKQIDKQTDIDRQIER